MLLGALPLLLLGVPEFLLELLQAFDQSANRSQALQPLQGFPLRRQGVPGLPGLGQLALCVLAGLQQPLLLGEPLLLAFQVLQGLLLLETRLGVGFQRRLEPGPGLLGQGQAAFQALLELLALLVGLAGALIGGFAHWLYRPVSVSFSSNAPRSLSLALRKALNSLWASSTARVNWAK